MATPRSLKRNLLNARDRLGESVISIVERDVAEHGPEVIEQLRQKNVVAYCKLIGDLVAFQKLAVERAAPKRKPRPLRMRELLKAMDDQPIDVNNPRLPKKHLDRWLEVVEAMRPKTPWDLTPDELRATSGDDLAAWFERQLRHASRAREAHDGDRLTPTILRDMCNQFLAADRVPNGMSGPEITAVIGNNFIRRITSARGKGWLYQLVRALAGGLYKAEIEALKDAGVDWPFPPAEDRGPRRPVMWEWV